MKQRYQICELHDIPKGQRVSRYGGMSVNRHTPNTHLVNTVIEIAKSSGYNMGQPIYLMIYEDGKRGEDGKVSWSFHICQHQKYLSKERIKSMIQAEKPVNFRNPFLIPGRN